MSTKAEIIAQLDELGIEHSSSATKAELEELLPTTDSRPLASTRRPVWEAGESRQEYHAKVRAWKLEQRR